MENNKVKISLAAIDPVVTVECPPLIESKNGRGFVGYGADNRYPYLLLGMYDNVTTLRSIINGCADYVCGEGSSKPAYDDLIKRLVTDYLIFGGYCIEVIRNRFNTVAKMNYIPFDRVRSNEDKTMLYYSDSWEKSIGRVKCMEVPMFDNDNPQPRSFYYYAPSRDGVYPKPIWYSAIKSVLTEAKVNEYHLNGISNGFASSAIINFNNGVPEDEQKREIEKMVNEKFCGSTNTGRVLLSFSDDKEHQTEISSFTTEDYGSKYTTCIERAREEIFLAFRATSNLFGLQKESVGFNTQEYGSSYKLFNKTMIQPMQKMICKSIEAITGEVITIEPFKIEFDNE